MTGRLVRNLDVIVGIWVGIVAYSAGRVVWGSTHDGLTAMVLTGLFVPLFFLVSDYVDAGATES